MIAGPLLMILNDALTGSDDFGLLVDSIVESFRTPQTQNDFALCAP